MERTVRMEPADEWRLTAKLQAGTGRGDPFAAAVRATRMAMIVTDPRRDDNPIVFANDAFLRLTGYARWEVTGRNCRFLQGPETEMDAVDRLRAAVRAEEPVTVDLLNYRRDGTTFHNALYVSPVHDEADRLLFYFASQLDVSDRYAYRRERDAANVALVSALATKTLLVREIDHRVKNTLQMVAAMIQLQSQDIADPAVRDALLSTIERIEALSTVHRRLHESDDVTRFDLGTIVRDLADTLLAATGRTDVALALDLAPITVRADASAALALAINECVTNALRHAFPDGRPGTLAIRTRRDGDRIEVVIEDDGVGRRPSERRSFGTELVEVLTRQLGAERTVSRRDPSGTRIALRLPADRTGA